MIALGVLTSAGTGTADAGPVHEQEAPVTVFAQTSFDDMVAYQRAHPEEVPTAAPYMEGPGPLVIPFAEREDFPIIEPVDSDELWEEATGWMAPLAPPLGTSFQGVIDDGCWIPPDTMGAAGPNHIVEILNSGFTVYNKAGGVVQAQRNLGGQGGCITAQVFFGALGTGVGQAADDVFDPKIIYDQYSGRWVVTADGNAHNRAGGGKTWVLVGISQTNDPTGAWNLWGIQSNTNDGVFNHAAPGDWSDYPGFGVDPNNVVITNNMFTIAGPPYVFIHADVWVIKKLDLINNVAAPSMKRFHDPGAVAPGLALGFTFQPTLTFGQTAATAKTYLVNEGWTDAGGVNRWLGMHQITGTGAAAALAFTGWFQVAGYNFCVADAAQPGAGTIPASCPLIETNDSRLLDAVLRNGKVWATHHVGAGTPNAHATSCTSGSTKAEVAWYELNPSTVTVTQQGRVVDNSTEPFHYYFPSIAVNQADFAALGFSGSSFNVLNGYVSAYYTMRAPTDPAGTMQAVGTLHAGLDNYWKMFPPGDRNRWGDYSATVIDPTDDRTFWTVQEYAECQANNVNCPPVAAACSEEMGVWGTWWGSFCGGSEVACADTIDNDCDGCTDAVDADCGGTETSCTDNIDNDCDGLVDCADSDCGEATCCSDGVDNDGDGCTDGADSDCGGTETSCTDTVDNDCDGLTDCADPDCGEATCCSDGQDNDNDGCVDGADSDCGGTETSCTDNIDNDCDGLTDCNDPDCAAGTETNCADNLDDDCDGCVDGADSDCGGTETSCTDNIDNDCDGLTDCNDPDCAAGTETNCADNLDDDCDGCTDGADSDCGGAETSCTDNVDNDCDGLTDCADPDCGEATCCSDGQDNDNDGCVDGADSDCGGTETSCTDNIDNDCDGLTDCNDPDCAAGTETNCANALDDDCDGCVDGADFDCGGTETSCTDNIDNDCDGLTDCNDPDCAAGTETNCTDTLDDDCDGCVDGVDSDCGGTETNCADGTDNDCDGLTDCNDPDCVSGTETNCTDNIDNDCDGFTDCNDSDCVGGTETNCTDGIDNDCDGFADCNDSDCAGSPACAGPMPAYSVDFQSPIMGFPDLGSGVPITEGDILTPPAGSPAPFSPPPPAISIFGGVPSPGPDLGLIAYAAAVGHPGGVPGFVELDALSFGNDAEVDMALWPEYRWSFSVDEHAGGFPGPAPDVTSEGPSVGGNAEASGDIFIDFPPGAMPPPPFIGPPCPIPPPPFTNTHLFDGDGFVPPVFPVLPPLPGGPVPHGVGLFEPNPPTPGTATDAGDNLDAVDMDTPMPQFPVYFSLDCAFPDGLELPPANSGSALANGIFVGGDVLVTTVPGGPPAVFAPAVMLGLDLAAGTDSDDLDALILHENGSGIFDPSTTFFDWVGGGTDMLLFSVRRSSAVIGLPDSFSGCPIEEGDILTTPIPPGMGGLSPFPAIFIPAESLGLLTARSAGPLPPPLFPPFGDELDALDVSRDCNGNGIPDRLDQVFGTITEGACCTDGVDNDGDGCIDGVDSDCGGTETNCADGLDDDCDGLTDCNDPDCVGGTETNCADGADNDCDGCIDNADSDCGGTETDCTNGVDDDCDGFTDCNDFDCDEASCCTDGADNDGDGCVDGADSDCGATETNCTDGLDNDCDGLTDCAGPDPDCISGGETNCANGLDEDCDGCVDNVDSDCGGTESNCTDGADDDCDGLTDCNDPDCDEASCCTDGTDNDGDGCVDGTDADCGGTETDCTNGVDDDCDGLTDCNDPDCDEASCCTDGTDNDGDGCVDGADSDCGGTETSCTDGTDNDCDGLNDCDDSDCAADVACQVGDPAVAPYPHDRRKNRYISFDPNKTDNDGNNIAFKVQLKAITLASCDGSTGGPVDFCREDRKECSGSGDPCTTDGDCPTGQTCVSTDCNACSSDGNACINQPIDCAPVPPQTCDPTGETCTNDKPDSGGSNVGLIWWLGPEHPSGNSVHLLVSQSFRKVSTNWPNPTHAGDCEVVPEARYGVRAVNVDTSTESNEVVVETTLFAPTSSSWWGDCVGPLKKFCDGDIRTAECAGDGDCTPPDTCDRAWTLPEGAVNVDDLTAALWTSAPAPPTTVAADFTWVDVHGNDSFTPGSQAFDPPNYVINVSDLQQVISAFGGRPYTFYDPADCPNTGTWP